jgi:hypothetical protein
MPTSERPVTDCARRAARRAGLVARKSRWRAGTIDNYGGFMLIEPLANITLAGFRVAPPYSAETDPP